MIKTELIYHSEYDIKKDALYVFSHLTNENYPNDKYDVSRLLINMESDITMWCLFNTNPSEPFNEYYTMLYTKMVRKRNIINILK